MKIANIMGIKNIPNAFILIVKYREFMPIAQKISMLDL
jgi:hypothetical protein